MALNSEVLPLLGLPTNATLIRRPLRAMQQVVEYERPASLETYRLEHKANKEELDKFLNTYKEYTDLVKKQKEAVTKEEKVSHPVHGSSTFMGIANFIVYTSVIQNTLSRCGLTCLLYTSRCV